ncbi:MAG: O-antigen ligase family protein [Clostridia bacterium]|nr:O-antigen ligase family protein [Clostridia bacterium]
MSLKLTDDFLIISLYILSSAMLFGQFMGIHIITSLAFAASFVVVLVLWCLHIRKANALDILAIFIIMLSFAGAIITCTSLSADYFYNWIMFIAVFLYFSVCFKIKLKKSTIKTMFALNFLSGAFCILAYFLRYNSAFYVTNIGIRYLKFDFYNPNALALFLVVIILTGMQYFFMYKVRLGLLFEVCYVAFFVFLIVQTLSRTSTLAILFFIIISIVFARKRSYYLPQNGIFKTLVTIFPLLFAFVYMLIIDIINQNGFLSFMAGEGKGLDSRQEVWSYAFDLFEQSPLVGSYGDLVTSSELSQMHNSHMNILVSYGIIVFIMVMIFLYMVLSKSIKNAKGNKGALAVWAFIVCLILGSGEAILFSGGLSFYLLVGQFLILSRADLGNEGELRL